MYRIQLTTSTDCGDLDNNYTHVQIMRSNRNRGQKTIDVQVALGYMSAGSFIKGKYSEESLLSICNVDAENMNYDDFIESTNGSDSELISDSWDKKILQYLLDVGTYVGSLSTT